MNNKKKLVLVLIALVLIICVTVGVTLAFLSYTKEGEKENTITVGAITFHYNEDSQGISLGDSLPISDSAGKTQNDYFEFAITSSNNMETAIPYQITSRKVSSPASELDNQYVKIALNKVARENDTDVENPTPVLFDTYNNLVTTQYNNHNEEILWTDSVPANTVSYTQKYRLRLWLSDQLDFSALKDNQGNYIEDNNGDYVYPHNNKQFSIKVNVYAGDAKQENPSPAVTNLSLNTGNISPVLDTNLGYDYVTSELPSGTTSTTLNVVTENANDTITVEKLSGIALNYNQSNIRRLSTTQNITLNNLESGDNYYRVTITNTLNESTSFIIKVVVSGNYTEALLHGTDPVLTSNLIPVTIDNTGKVYRASLTSSWYNYGNKQWANAVVLKDDSIEYLSSQEIPESNIQSYFVWIPKYSYKIWNLGNYNSLTSIDSSKNHPIDIVFGTTNTVDSETECATPLTAGASGNCSIGKYMTHPAFITMNTNGIWVGKFETGYDGATSLSGAMQNKIDTSKIIIKPNVYSWRGITLGNAFRNSIQYMSSEDSHLMKNTEWGAVAYLSNSIYGMCTGTTCNEVRINNNSYYITGYASKYDTSSGNYQTDSAQFTNGSSTYYYFDANSNRASTTQNYTGIYDMSGGGQEYVAAYHTSGIGTSADKTGFTITSFNSKYYDGYTTSSGTNYSNRILGDATGELGPFAATNDSRQKSSWYSDYAFTISSDFPAIGRGSYYSDGYIAGLMAFDHNYGNDKEGRTFRIVLAPSSN